MSDEMSVKYDSLCVAALRFKLFIQVCSVARSKMTEIRPTQRVLSIAASNAKNPVGLNDTIAISFFNEIASFRTDNSNYLRTLSSMRI